MSSINHGTAVASMLVGGSKWGSLLPGAHLSAANVFAQNEKGKIQSQREKRSQSDQLEDKTKGEGHQFQHWRPLQSTGEEGC